MKIEEEDLECRMQVKAKGPRFFNFLGQFVCFCSTRRKKLKIERHLSTPKLTVPNPEEIYVLLTKEGFLELKGLALSLLSLKKLIERKGFAHEEVMRYMQQITERTSSDCALIEPLPQTPIYRSRANSWEDTPCPSPEY